MTALKQSILRQIALQGPISVADYMTLCLLHPQHGYYSTRDPLGRAGDFITAPEISQMFGELLGLCLAQVWIAHGRPAPFTLAELGPGRGTLMVDLLRATRQVPGFHDSLRLHLVEASPVLRARQKDALAPHAPQFHDTAESLPEATLFLIANEFFDALPIRQFLRQGAGWAERVIWAEGDRLLFGLSPAARLGALEHRTGDTEDGQMIETRPAADSVMAPINARIAAHGGCALIIDYGDWRSRGDTLQALRAHEYDDPLANPGAADLTAHVDFEALALAAPDLRATPLTPQGAFLERLGIGMRAEQLARHLDGPARESHLAAYRRLTHAEEMGHLFKVMGLTGRDAPPLPGFDV